MIRRNFITTAIGGLAWLCGVKPVSAGVDLGRSWTSMYAVGADGKAHPLTSVPKLGEKHPDTTAKAKAKLATELSNGLWEVVVEYDDCASLVGIAVGGSAREVIDGQWHRMDRTPRGFTELKGIPSMRVVKAQEFGVMTLNEWRKPE